MVEKIRTIGWRSVEMAALVVVLCILLHIILGDEGGSFITAVALNAMLFAQDIPAGTLLGAVILLSAYWFFKRDRRA